VFRHLSLQPDTSSEQENIMDEAAHHGEEDVLCAAFSPFDGRLNARIATSS
jgi:hypothetical protein